MEKIKYLPTLDNVFMIDFLTEYSMTLAVGTPLVFFILGVAFRLLDTSASIFMEHDIVVTSSYVTTKEINKVLQVAKYPEIIKSLKKTLIIRKLHDLCMLMAIISTVLCVCYVAIMFISN